MPTSTVDPDEPEVPNTDFELGSVVAVDKAISGRSATRSVMCHITPTDDGYPIVIPIGPCSCADAKCGCNSTHATATAHRRTSLLFMAEPLNGGPRPKPGPLRTRRTAAGQW